MKYVTAVLAVALVAGFAATAGALTWTEDFESGFTGTAIGNHAEWGPSGAGPTPTAGSGLLGSVGLPHHGNIFNWSAHPFDWKAAGFPGIVLQMDFSTNANAHFDDDRLVWTIDKNSTSSSAVFGVQLDQSDGGIVSYWRDSGGSRIQDPIAATPGLKANTWYRFTNTITKLGATNAKVDVHLVELDAAGNPTGTPITGTIPDTDLWPGGAPDTKYFTGAEQYPAYKNYNHGLADNAGFAVIPEPSTMVLAVLGLAGLLVLAWRRRS